YLGQALIAHGSHDEAVAAFSKVIELNPKKTLYAAYRERGRALAAMGQREEAIDQFSKAIELNSSCSSSLHFRGNAHAALSQWSKAVSDYSGALALVADRHDVLNSLAWLLATCPDPGFRDPSRAVELARKAITLSPTQGSYWNTLGAAHYRAGSWDAAFMDLQKSMEVRQGGDGFDWIFLAMTRWQMGEKEEARNWYDQAIRWIEKNRPCDEELRGLRLEAAALLQIDQRNAKPE